MVLALAFDSMMDLQALQCKSTPLWLDLVEVPPLLEVEANQMLESIGPVLHLTVKATHSKFPNIWARVLLDLTEEIPEGIEISIQGF
jgi:hypothetical protein